jgi:hypothetical protein
LYKLIKGASINATLRALAKEDLYKTQLVVQARAKRQKGDQRVVLKGGLIYTKDGRLKVSQRVRAEAEKAARAAARAVKKRAAEAVAAPILDRE